MIETDVERYADIKEFAREVNLPLLGGARLDPVPAGATISRLLSVQAPEELKSVVESLAEARQSLTLRALLLAGFAEDTTSFAAGLALGREWSRRGLRVAVVDLEFRNPTLARPGPHPNEGIVDVLEYGCSFRRVAWEISAGSLWVIGPGSHVPDQERLADHPDWDRMARGFATHVDVTIYVAPLLDLRGYVGRLSKRMDGVLLAASADRVGRTDLRDAFLELWGSDAPIIGCIELESDAPIQPRSQTEPAPAYAPTPPPPSAPVSEAAEGAPAMAASVEVPIEETRPPVVEPAIPAPSAHGAGPDRSDGDLAAVLDREIRFGRSAPVMKRRSPAALVAGIAAGLAVAASITLVLLRNPKLPAGSSEREVMPAGTERVLPAAPEKPLEAGLGGGASSPLPSVDTPPVSAPAPPPEAIPPSDAVEGKPFRVHVASFRSEAKVQEIVRGLRLRGAEAWFEPAPDAPGYYRVFVGHFATEAEARAHAQWLLDNGWVDRAHAFPSTQR